MLKCSARIFADGDSCHRDDSSYHLKEVSLQKVSLRPSILMTATATQGGCATSHWSSSALFAPLPSTCTVNSFVCVHTCVCMRVSGAMYCELHVVYRKKREKKDRHSFMGHCKTWFRPCFQLLHDLIVLVRQFVILLLPLLPYVKQQVNCQYSTWWTCATQILSI